MIRVESIKIPGIIVNGLPIQLKDVLSLILFTAPCFAENKDVLFKGHLCNEIDLPRDVSQPWNAFKTSHYAVWHGEKKDVMHIQYGPYDNHRIEVSAKCLRETLWPYVTSGLDALKAGNRFMREVAPNYYQIGSHRVGRRGYYVHIAGECAQVVYTSFRMVDGKLEADSSAKVFSHRLCYGNVSMGTPPEFKTSGFTVETYLPEYSERAPCFFTLESPKDPMCKV